MVWQQIASYVAAATPVAIESYATEEEFVLQSIFEQVIKALDFPKLPIYTWDSARQLKLLKYHPVAGIAYEEPKPKLEGYELGKGSPFANLNGLIAYLGGLKGRNGLFIFLDGHQFLAARDENAMAFHRRIRVLADRFKKSGQEADDEGFTRRFMFLGQNISLAPELSRIIPRLVVPHPTPEEIRHEMQLQGAAFLKVPEYDGYSMPEPDDEPMWLKLVRNAQGLTRKQIEQVIARSANDHECLGEPTVGYLYEAKLRNLDELGLEVYPAPKSAIGGLSEVRRWLQQRIALFNDADADDDLLRGIMVVGVPGCGKSLLATTVGEMLQAPVVLLQADKIFGSLVGQSEQKVRSIFNAMEAIAPAVLWIDEAERLFATSETDSVGSKVLGMFLSWMQEKTAPVFVVATANDISALPAQLLRKGRFDEIFFVDLPTLSERREIAEIHLKKRGKAMNEAERLTLVEPIAQATDGYSGSEIAEIIKAAELSARLRDEKGWIGLEDVKAEIEATQPLSKQEAQKIEWMRERAKSFRPAHIEQAEPVVEAAASRTAPRRMKAVAK